MKRLILTLVLPFILLVGCSSEEDPSDEPFNAGIEAYESKDFDGSIKQFQTALKLNPERTDAQKNLTKVKDEYFKKLIEAGNKAYEGKLYSEAINYYQKAKKINNIKDPELLEKLEFSKEMKSKQDGLTDYYKWLDEVAAKNNHITNEWRNIADSLATGAKKREEVKGTLENLIEKSNKIITLAEEKALNLEAQLGELHNEYMIQLRKNHDTLRSLVVEVQKPLAEGQTFEPLSLINLGANVSNTSEHHSRHLQAVKQYSVENELRLPN